MKRFHLFFLLLFLNVSLFGLTNWTGNVNTDWFNPANWDNGLPAAGNDAIIPAAPIGGLFPEIDVLVIQNYQIDNRGIVTIGNNGGVSNSNTFINRSGATLNLSIASATFSNGPGANFFNYGIVSNSGVFTNDGSLINYENAAIGNFNQWYNNPGGSLSNRGDLINTSVLMNMGNLTNVGLGTYTNIGLTNNNGSFTNAGTGEIIVSLGSEFRNNQTLTNEGSGVINVNGVLNNFGNFWNQASATLNVNAGGTVNNSVNIVNRNNAVVLNHGLINNFFCATIINENSLTNFSTINNNGFIWNYATITPNAPINIGNGVTITPANAHGLCNDIVRALDGIGTPIVVNAADLVNPMMPFCAGNYSFNINGANSIVFDCSNWGVNVVTVTINGPLGWSITCDAEVTITDPHPAQPACMPATIEIPAGGVATVVPTDIFAGGFDNCGIINLVSVSPNMFYCAQIGVHTVTLTVNDGHNNISTCDAQVTIQDTTAPTLDCKDATLVLDGNGNATLTEADVIVLKYDHCGIMATHISQTDFNCDNVGANQVTVTVTDHVGLSTSCNTTVTVEDNMAPVLGCQPELQGHSEPGVCGAHLHPAPPIVLAENCGIATVKNDAPNFFPVGTTVVTWEVIDVNGNSSTCTQDVVVWDWEAPSITCNSVVYHLPENKCVVPGTVVNNFQPFVDDNCGIEEVYHNALPAYTPGMYAVEWTAVDVNGNANTCAQWVKVIDQYAPALAGCPDDITAPVTDDCWGPASWNDPTASDICGVASIESSHNSGDLFKVGDTEVTITAKDVNGNEATCSFTVTIEDDSSPLIISAPTNIYLEVDNCGDVIAAEWEELEVNDVCGVININSDYKSGDEFPAGVTTVNYQIVDGSGNEIYYSFDVNVTANVEMKCLDDLYVSGSSNVSWNDMVPESVCADCPQGDLEGYSFLGWHEGHQYYLSDEKTTWEAAQLSAEEHGGYLATMEDVTENDFVSSFMSIYIKSAWIGYINAGNGFSAADNSTDDYTNWNNGSPVADETKNAALLRNNGLWVNENSEMMRRSIIEIPCFDVELSTPAGNQNGDFYTEDIYTITYEVEDMCGNICECSFDVHVVSADQKVGYCTVAGDGELFVANVGIEGTEKASSSNGGYANHLEFAFPITKELSELTLTAGGVDEDQLLFWRIWVDQNQDGDFFDNGEMIFEQSAKGTISELHDFGTNLPLNSTRMRVAVSQGSFVEACGDYLAGEVEDFRIVNEMIDEKGTFNGNTGNTISTASMSLYPNPASSVVTVNTKDFEGNAGTVKVFNSIGQLTQEFSRESMDVNFQLDLTDYNEGVYTIVLDVEGFEKAAKTFVVSK